MLVVLCPGANANASDDLVLSSLLNVLLIHAISFAGFKNSSETGDLKTRWPI